MRVKNLAVVFLAIATHSISSLAQYSNISSFMTHEQAAVQWDAIAKQDFLNSAARMNRDQAIRMAIGSISSYGALAGSDFRELETFGIQMSRKADAQSFNSFELKSMYNEASRIGLRASTENYSRIAPSLDAGTLGTLLFEYNNKKFNAIGTSSSFYYSDMIRITERAMRNPSPFPGSPYPPVIQPGFPQQPPIIIVPPAPQGPLVVERMIECRSDNSNTRLCGAGLSRTLEKPVLIRQTSQSACIEGTSFRILDNNQVEVSKGCRATFKFKGITEASPSQADVIVGQVITTEMNCESKNLSERTCGPSGPGQVLSIKFRRQNSGAACTKDVSYKIEANQVKVSNGCRATFIVEKIVSL